MPSLMFRYCHQRGFYQKQNGILFESMTELYKEGKPVDLVTLQNKLKEKDVPESMKSLEFIRDLLEAVPTSANAKQYAQIVKEKSTLRKLIRVTEEITKGLLSRKGRGSADPGKDGKRRVRTFAGSQRP